MHGPGDEPWEVYTVKADAPDATGIHGVGQPDTGECLCGTPAGAEASLTSLSDRRQPRARSTCPRVVPSDFLIAPDGRLVDRRYGLHAYDRWTVDELLDRARAARTA